MQYANKLMYKIIDVQNNGTANLKNCVIFNMFVLFYNFYV